MEDEPKLGAELKANWHTAPRLTPAMIDAVIKSAQYHRFAGTTTTVCLLTLRNGFGVVGESACVSPENFDSEVGERIAFGNAREKIWQLEGYRLRQMLRDASIEAKSGP